MSRQKDLHVRIFSMKNSMTWSRNKKVVLQLGYCQPKIRFQSIFQKTWKGSIKESQSKGGIVFCPICTAKHNKVKEELLCWSRHHTASESFVCTFFPRSLSCNQSKTYLSFGLIAWKIDCMKDQNLLKFWIQTYCVSWSKPLFLTKYNAVFVRAV